MATQPPPEPDKKRSEIPEVLPWAQYLRRRSSEVIARSRNTRQIATLARYLREIYQRPPSGHREGWFSRNRQDNRRPLFRQLGLGLGPLPATAIRGSISTALEGGEGP